MSETSPKNQERIERPTAGAEVETEGQTPSRPDPGEKPVPSEGHGGSRGASRLSSLTGVMAILPAAALLVMSLALSIATAVRLVEVLAETLGGHIDLIHLSVEFVEFTDFFLLATVLYITSLGLFSLFVTDRVPVPTWLTFRDFDDLKERLIGVVVVMLAVFFLGEVLREEGGLDLLWLGLSISSVFLSLSLFVRSVFRGEH